MSKLVAIIAPMLVGKQHEADFRIVLGQNNQELNLKFLYNFIKNNYIRKQQEDQYNYNEDMLPAAGYYLSSTLRLAGYDTFLTQSYNKTTLENIAGINPRAICLSTTMISHKSAFIHIIKEIRKVMPDIKIIVGGIFTLKSFITRNSRNARIAEEEANWELFNCYEKEYENCIFIVSHHGISSLLHVLKELEKGTKGYYDDIHNLVLPRNHDLFFTQYKLDIIDLNKEYIHWDILDRLPRRIPMRTSIGCPYRCEYCDFCTLYPRLFLKNIATIHTELTALKKILESRHRSAILIFTDDNIFFNNKRLEDICKTIINSEINIPWSSFMRASSITTSSIQLQKESNQIGATMGIESGDHEILKALNKKQDLQQVKTTIELLDQNRIFTLLTLLIGFPGETKETVNNTASFINSLEFPNLFTTFQLYPLKISPLSKISTRESREKWKIKGMFDTWSHATMDSEQAKNEVYRLFKAIDSISNSYRDESPFFLFQYTTEQRKKLIDLRKKLTIAIYEHEPVMKIQSIIVEIASSMNLTVQPPGQEIIEQMKVPGC